MMGALLVALAATAVFKGIDGASAVSSASKSQAIAASLAQDDQERLRALAPQSLVDIADPPRVVTRSNVEYTVASTSKWVADREATPDCNTTTSRAGYLRITSTVTWPDMRGSRPIVASSFVAPPNGTVTSNRGAVGIKILDGRDQGVPGVSVAISGAGLTSALTDANGCAYWDDVPQGNYSYTAGRTGYVDPNGSATISRSIGVAGGQTRLDTAYLDVAETVDFAFRTRDYSGNVLSMPAASGQLNLASNKLTATNGVKSIPFAGSSTLRVTGLFPTQYGAFVGSCAVENNPAEYGSSDPSQVVAPPFDSPELVFVPPLKVVVRLDGVPTAGARVKIVPKRAVGSSCPLPAYPVLTTDATGRLPATNLAYPYGRYAICAQATINGVTGHIRFGSTANNVESTGDRVHISPNGTDVAIAATTSPRNYTDGACP